MQILKHNILHEILLSSVHANISNFMYVDTFTFGGVGKDSLYRVDGDIVHVVRLQYELSEKSRRADRSEPLELYQVAGVVLHLVRWGHTQGHYTISCNL